MAKEIDLRGVFRWGVEFDWAVDYLSTRRVDVRPLLSGQFPLSDAVAAFPAAADKTKNTKVQVWRTPEGEDTIVTARDRTSKLEESSMRHCSSSIHRFLPPRSRWRPSSVISGGPALAQQKIKWAHVYET